MAKIVFWPLSILDRNIFRYMSNKITTQTLADETREGQAMTATGGEIIETPGGEEDEAEEDEIDYIHVLKVRK